MSKLHLLSLPRELRDHVWTLTFANTLTTPFPTSDRDWFFYPARQRCHACGSSSTNLPCLRHVLNPLLTCKQLYAEAYPIFLSSLHLSIAKSSHLQQIRTAVRLRPALTHLTLTLHINDSNRDSWHDELVRLPSTFPALTHLSIHNHMRPPISHQNLVDAIYLAGPLTTFPPRLTLSSPALSLSFAYTEDEIMFSTDELGTIWYRDALDAHAHLIRELIDDPQFKEYAAQDNVHAVTERLLVMAQQHEQPWLDSIRRRRRRRFCSAAEPEQEPEAHRAREEQVAGERAAEGAGDA